MNLTAAQRDALVELVNIGAGKAGKQLSVLLADTIEMNVPVVELVAYDELPRLLDMDNAAEAVCIHQQISGAVAGQVLLLFHSEESQQLVQTLIGLQPPGAGIDVRSFEHEAMTEIGNIIISACVSVMADFIGSTIRLQIPHYHQGPLSIVLRHAMPLEAGEILGLFMRINLRAARRAVAGTLVMTFSLADMNALLARLDALVSGYSQP